MAKHLPEGDIATQKALADAVGLSPGRISQIVNGGGWPFGRGPWSRADVDAIRGHIASRRSENNATAVASATAEGVIDDGLRALHSLTPLNKAKLKLTLERAASVKFDRELKAGGFVQREEIERERVARVFAIRGRLSDLPLRAHLLVGKSEREIEVAIREWAREICNFFASRETNHAGKI